MVIGIRHMEIHETELLVIEPNPCEVEIAPVEFEKF
jgi:hypothetical protein